MTRPVRLALYASPYGGKKYHRTETCEGLNATCIANQITGVPPITRTEIRRRGLTPCAICKPPPMLSVATEERP